MKKIVFICSHLCSGSSALYDAMNENPRIHGFKQNSLNAYESPFNLVTLTNKTHKMNNASAIYMDELLKNYQFTSKESYSYCNFIYIVRSPEFTITGVAETPLTGTLNPSSFTNCLNAVLISSIVFYN
jgi:hypothetical protein